MLFLLLCAAILFNRECSAGDCVSQQADECTSRFMSLDRIEAAVQGGPNSEDHVLGNVKYFPTLNEQDIDPNIYFTCDGSILRWTYAAQWDNGSQAYSELQIWRSSGNGSYTKVGSTTLILEKESSSHIYQITLTSPLPFQAGDILGWFQHNTSAHLLYEYVGSGHPTLYVIQESPSSQFTLRGTSWFDGVHILVNVETDPAGCDCGFMSVERMEILLRQRAVRDRALFNPRQQITPGIEFTCDGLITEWIIGAEWNNLGSSYPEIQVWRNLGNDVYHKIKGTFIYVTAQNAANIYKYVVHPPIPVLAGDILGVFQPQVDRSKLGLWSEMDNGPLTYYLSTGGTATESPFDTIDFQSMPSLSSQRYHPLVTVEIHPNPSLPTSSLTSSPPELVATPPVSATHSLPTSTTPPPPTNEGDGAIINNFVGVGTLVAGTLLVLITAAVIIITALVCLIMRKRNKLTSASEVKVCANSTSTNSTFVTARFTCIQQAYPTAPSHSESDSDTYDYIN